MRKPAPLSPASLSLCLLGSGLTALVYELLWARRLQLTFGSTTLSVTTVLASFMAGLGIGSYLIGRRVDRTPTSGIRVYGYLELAVGLYALASLPILGLVERGYATLQTSLQLAPAGATLLKFALCFPALAFPSALMGGTLPALVKGVMRSRSLLPGTVGRLYGINTAGAALGTLLAGMVLVEFLGLQRSMLAAALVNLAIAAWVLLRTRGEQLADTPSASPDASLAVFSSREREDVVPVEAGRGFWRWCIGQTSSTSADERQKDARFQSFAVEKGAKLTSDPAAAELSLRQHLCMPPVRFCAVAVFVTGLLSMLYEVVWTRLLSLVLGSSTYAFSIVLGIFLIGIALGSLLFSRASRRGPPSAAGLTLLLQGLALWAMVSMVLIPWVPWLLMSLGQLPGVTFARVLGFEVAVAAAVLLVPTLALGAALPMAMGIISRSAGRVGGDVGGVYLVNTAGSILGSLSAGFVLLPWLGSQVTLLCGLALNVLICAWGVWSFSPPRRQRLQQALLVTLFAVAATQPPWPDEVFSSGIGYRLHKAAVKNLRSMHVVLNRRPSRLLMQQEGRNTTVAVQEYADHISLLVNGKPDASTGNDMTTQVTLGVIPTMAHPAPRDVAVVGWGSGVTAHAVRQFPSVQRIDVAEIEPAVLDASHFFHAVNGAVERDPKVRVIFDDARSYFLTATRRYDVIISEPSNVWVAGVSGLFSVDFYQLAKRRLRRGGVFGQWLQTYSIGAPAIRIVLRTLSSCFKHTQLWVSDGGNLILLASDEPLAIPVQRVVNAYEQNPALQQLMTTWGPGPRPGHYFGAFMLDERGIDAVLAKAPPDEAATLMTDDKPILEYRAVRGLYDTHHKHIDALVTAKLALGQLFPIGAADGARPGEAIAGAARILRSPKRIRRTIAAFGERFNTDPQARLAQALALTSEADGSYAIEIAKTLPHDSPYYHSEAALIEARILLGQEEPEAALQRLAEITDHTRPSVVLYYKLKAANSMRDTEAAFAHARLLQKRLANPGLVESLSLPRKAVYKELTVLAMASQEWARMMEIVQAGTHDPLGSYHRNLLQATLAQRMGQTNEATRAMDALLQWRPTDAPPLELCIEIYRAVGNVDRAAQCSNRLNRLNPAPSATPLWR